MNQEEKDYDTRTGYNGTDWEPDWELLLIRTHRRPGVFTSLRFQACPSGKALLVALTCQRLTR